MMALFTPLIATFMAKEGMEMIQKDSLPVIGSISGSHGYLSPSRTPGMKDTGTHERFA